MAWNWGRRALLAGLSLQVLGPDRADVWALGYGVLEVEAEARLGPDGFRSWAVRGWLEENASDG